MPVMQVLPIFPGQGGFRGGYQNFIPEDSNVIEIRSDLPPRYQKKVLHKEFNKILKAKAKQTSRSNL